LGEYCTEQYSPSYEILSPCSLLTTICSCAVPNRCTIDDFKSCEDSSEFDDKLATEIPKLNTDFDISNPEHNIALMIWLDDCKANLTTHSSNPNGTISPSTTAEPTYVTEQPTYQPSNTPTSTPTLNPTTSNPTTAPTNTPTNAPTLNPTENPTENPTNETCYPECSQNTIDCPDNNVGIQERRRLLASGFMITINMENNTFQNVGTVFSFGSNTVFLRGSTTVSVDNYNDLKFAISTFCASDQHHRKIHIHIEKDIEFYDPIDIPSNCPLTCW
jgi:hypothetical protein